MRTLPLAALLLLSACANYPAVRTDFDSTANFANYHSYTWIPLDVPRGMNPIMFRRVQGSIDRALQARGYTHATPGDFAIAFTIGERDRTEAHDYGYWGWGGYWGHGWGCCGWGHGWGGWGSGWGGWGYPSVDVYTVTDRSLIIDIYDVPTKRPIWHGVITKTTYPDSAPDYSKLDANVDAVLAKFPPQLAPVGAAPASGAGAHQTTTSR
jgi:hypothetical protein